MGDFIKDLNAIDFLGIMMPGSAFLLLLAYMEDLSAGNESASLLYSYFGTTSPSIGQGILLIAFGYFLGMLFHELGDLLEGLSWRCKSLNPQYKAAYDVYKRVQAKSIGQAEIVVFPIVLLVIIFLCAWINQFDDDSYIKYTDIIINLISIVIYLSYNLAKSKILEKNEILEKENLEIESKVHALPEIQTKIEKSGNIRKRTIFDGFHLMMRNLFLVIFFVDLFAAIIKCPSPLTSCVVSISKNDPQIPRWTCALIILFAQLLMLSRYYHFAYLKYKYIFEDYNLLFPIDINSKSTTELDGNARRYIVYVREERSERFCGPQT